MPEDERRDFDHGKMNIDLRPRRPGEILDYTGPHLCVTCAQEGRIVNLPLKKGEKAPLCPSCGERASWQP